AVPWYAAMRWQGTPEAARAERNADAPTPIWLTPSPLATAAATASPLPTLVPAVALPPAPPPPPPATGPPPAPPPALLAPPPLSAPIALDARIAAAPTATPSISDLKLTDSAFTFDDPPEPGAHVRLTLTVHNPTEQDSGPISVALPTTWLPGYNLQTTSPALV